MKKRLTVILSLLLALAMLFTGCSFSLDDGDDGDGGKGPQSPISLDSIPDYDGSADYVVINNNVPFFTDEKCDSSYESFSELDSLGRCGVAIACIGIDLMPTEDRGEIGHVRPSGWHSVQYDIVPGKNLYNRCHLIGFQLTGENDNEKNLITGTRNMNNEGMLPFENMIADYIKETENHVLYRVSPIFKDNELVARGVLMEAKSVEDDEICFCIYVYNNQPGVKINYKTGESSLADDPLSGVVNENHDKSEILPSLTPSSVTEIYAEYVDDEFSGCLIMVSGNGYNGAVKLAVDISETGEIVLVRVLDHKESKWSGIDEFVASLSGESADSLYDVELVSGATVTSTAIKGAVIEALTAYDLFVDGMKNGETFIINVSSGKFHEPTCSGAVSMSEKNKLVYVGFCDDLINAGYQPCGTCDPDIK